MKKIFAWASAIVAIMLLTGAVPMIGIVKAAIPVPHNMWGHPLDETSVQMPVGELITSWIDGVEYGRSTTFMAALEVWFDVDTAGNWVTAPGDPNTVWRKEGGDLNESIMYAWGDMTNIKTDPDADTVLDYGVFLETDLWMTTKVLRQDLNLSALADQPTHFPKISQIIPEPNDIWPDYVLIYTEDPAFLMDGYYLEKNDGFLNGPVQTLTGISNTSAYFYANLTAIDLDPCGDELKLVWTNTGPAFGGMDIVVDRVEWNATVGGCHYTEPDNTIATDATAPATGLAMRRTGTFPVYADDTNDNAVDFITDIPWPRPIIGAPTIAWDIPTGGEKWTGGMDHTIQITAYDDLALNSQLDFWINYSTDNGGSWAVATLAGYPSHPFNGSGDAVTPMVFNWAVPCDRPYTNLALLNATGINPNGKVAEKFTLPFTIDCQAPTVFSTDPTPPAFNIPTDQVITVTFSEAMGATNASIDPNPGGVGTIPLTADSIEISHNVLAENVYYCVYVFGSDDSVTGNNMTAVYSFCFTTYIVTIPEITVTVPAGGEIWSGGNLHDIEFTSNHAGTGVVWFWINYTCLLTPSVLIVSGTDLTTPYSWDVPTIDDIDCTVTIDVQDTDDNEKNTSTSLLFEIDSTDPTASNVPVDGQTDVLVDTTVVVTFSEKMDMPATEGAFSMQDTPTSTSVSGTFSWDVTEEIMTFTPDSNLAGATEYCFTITTAAKDVSDPGNNMAADYTSCFTIETTNTAPTIALTNPTTATVWTGGGSGVIDWTMSDLETAEADLTVNVSYIYNSVTTPITTTSLAGLLTYTWDPVACPAGASTDATVQIYVVVTDEGGLTNDSTSDAFTIDCTPSGAVAHTGDLKVDKTLTFSITNPSAGIVTYAWSFGDGAIGTGAAPTHAYDEAGTYQVTCTLTDSDGNSADATPATLTIEEEDEPVFDIMDYWWIILIIVVVAIIAIIALAKRKKPEEEAPAEEEEEEYEEEEPEEELVEEEEYEEEEVVEEEPEVEEEVAPAEPEPAPEPAPEAAPAAAAAAPAAEEAAPAEEAPAGETKECPSCGTVVPSDASECFLCGATL
ncbi:MAG: Ig-like domain-containing protein [Thermoplasmata archaeon]|nr:Ig-like domain-containing protein [Thermoplasmata archaeon]